MRVTRNPACHIQPEKQTNYTESEIPVIDATYAYHRTLPSIYLFEKDAVDEQTRVARLKESLARTLNDFPQFAGRVEPQEADIGEEKLQRTKAVWGRRDDPGVEFVEARTVSKLSLLLPPSVDGRTPYVWDRSAASLRPLFSQHRSARHTCRIQHTTFGCKGWSIGFDVDHGLADAHAVGLFMNYWSANYSNLLKPGRIWTDTMATIPEIVWQPNILEEPIAQLVRSYGAETVLEEASTLPTRRPDYRGDASIPVGPEHISLPNQRHASQIVSCMLHISPAEYERVTEDIRARARVSIGHQAAIVSFLWAALNRARTVVKTYHVGLHMSVNLRYRLGLPEGLLGCPNLVVMMGGKDTSTDPVALAEEITATLERHDENAMLSVVYAAMQRPSPLARERPQALREFLELSVAIQVRANDVSFGGNKPLFLAPIIPIPHLCIIRGGTRLVGGRWHHEGADCFLSLPDDEMDALLTDPTFAHFEKFRAL